MKLADGSLGKLELTQLGDDADDDADGAFNTPPGSPAYRGSSRSPKKPRERERGATDFTDAELDLSYWFPLLAGLSRKLTFDARRDIRRSALEVCSTYSSFTATTSRRGSGPGSTSILMPCLTRVRAEVCDADVRPPPRPRPIPPHPQQSPHPPRPPGNRPRIPGTNPSRRDRNAEADAWLYQTCQHCLELVVDLTAQFYPAVDADRRTSCPSFWRCCPGWR